MLLHHYAETGQIECIKVILAALKHINFNKSFEEFCDDEIEHWPKQEQYFPTQEDYLDWSAPWSALDCAAKAWPVYPADPGKVISATRIEIVRLLLEAGADPEFYDPTQARPQHLEYNPTLKTLLDKHRALREAKMAEAIEFAFLFKETMGEPPMDASLDTSLGGAGSGSG